MKKYFYRFLLPTILFSLLFYGCSRRNRIDIFKAGKVIPVIMPSGSNIYLSKINAYEKDTFVVISGILKRRHSQVTPKGHVDLFIHSMEGTPIKKISALFSPRRLRKKGAKEARFQVKIPFLLPKGSMIHAAFHKSSDYFQKNVFDCGQNAANLNSTLSTLKKSYKKPNISSK